MKRQAVGNESSPTQVPLELSEVPSRDRLSASLARQSFLGLPARQGRASSPTAETYPAPSGHYALSLDTLCTASHSHLELRVSGRYESLHDGARE